MEYILFWKKKKRKIKLPLTFVIYWACQQILLSRIPTTFLRKSIALKVYSKAVFLGIIDFHYLVQKALMSIDNRECKILISISIIKLK